MTLDDLEWPKHILVENSFYGAHQKNLNECRPIISAANCRPMILVFRNIKYMRIFAGVPRKEGDK